MCSPAPTGGAAAAILRAIVTDYDLEPAPTRSELERGFLQLCREAALPSPRVNAWVTVNGDGLEAGFSWPDQRLIAELDGYGVHGTRAAFARDRRRDRILLVGGWRVARFTWRQLIREPDDVVDTIGRLLSR